MAGTGAGRDKKMMKRRSSLPSMPLLDPAVTMRDASLLKVAKTGGGASREKSSRWQQKKAITFDLDDNPDQAGFPRTWQLVSYLKDKGRHTVCLTYCLADRLSGTNGPSRIQVRLYCKEQLLNQR